MKRFAAALLRYRAAVAPRADAMARVRGRLEESTGARSRATLGVLRDVSPAVATRVRTRLDPVVTTAIPARPTRWRAPLALLVVAVAALVVLRLPFPPVLVDLPLRSDDLREQPLGSLVTLHYRGLGEVDGTESAPRVAWRQGELHVDVTPHRGVDLVVQTDEAEVRVVGTVFSVRRDVLGTTVGVERGRVSVRCVGDAPVTIGANETRVCAPVRPAGLLARALALSDGGAPADDVLAALDRGLALEPKEGTLRTELEVARVGTLADAGRAEEARAAADALLATGAGARRGEVARIAAKLALPVGGCAASLRYLDAIPDDDRAPSDEIARADCLAPSDPAGARAALEAALALGPPAPLAERIRARLARLTP